MIRFNNDYNHGAHPKILKALIETNGESYAGYGVDEWCEKGADEIKKYLGDANADIHFTVGGTATNLIVIDAALRHFQSVISADTGHIFVNETGAVENSGHKILGLPSKDGKITAEQIAARAELFRTSPIKEHITQPKLVYISFPTEYGTIYSKSELEEIRKVCDEYSLYLFIDGARLGYGLGSKKCDADLAGLARLTDVFSIGGTKCGLLFGEAVVITNDALKENFRSYMRSYGGILAKGWLLGLQFSVMFKDGLYFDITKEADRKAERIKEACRSAGLKLYADSPTNQQFVIVDKETKQKLAEKYYFEEEGNCSDGEIIRFCASWSTTDEEVCALCNDLAKLKK